MTAARRQSKDPLEFYETPPETTRAILHIVLNPVVLRGTRVLDPCCGNGAILDVVTDRYSCVLTHGIELHRERAFRAMARHSVAHEDALTCPWPLVDAVIANPPFSLAMPFVEHALMSGATVMAFLLRLAFLETKGRAEFHRLHPSDVYVLPRRPSFTGDSKCDSSAYAWFVWGVGRGGRWSILGDS